jgi:replication factor A1
MFDTFCIFRFQQALVGDSSACILLTWRNEQGSFLKPGQFIYVRNGKIEMFKNHMRLAVDKWGLIEPATDLTAQQQQVQVNTATNLSDTEYELINVPA